MMYKEVIKSLISAANKDLIDLSVPREKASRPTQASSNFITNKEQGDWAERLIVEAINSVSSNYVAVKYGKSDDRVAGEDGFDEFFKEYQEELDEIGKRPDILIFKKGDYDATKWGRDLCEISVAEMHEIVPKAIAGLEVRSSAFLLEKYESAMRKRFEHFSKEIFEIKERILGEFSDLLEGNKHRSGYIGILNSMNLENLSEIEFRVPSWKSSERLTELSNLFKSLKTALKEVQKREFLSITPKVEDLKVVYKWIQEFNVPHFYCQVFFDQVYAISFKRILEIIGNPDNEDEKFIVESDVKNQNKSAIKINTHEGIMLASKVEMPRHYSKMKEFDRGRLLFYVAFEGGVASLNISHLAELLKIPVEEL